MSEVVHYEGKIQLIAKFPNETLEEQCKRILNNFGHMEIHSYCDSWADMIYEELYDQYIIIDDDLYCVVSQNEYSENDVYNISDNKDGTYNYEVMYYNGGCSFTDAISRAFEKSKRLKE